MYIPGKKRPRPRRRKDKEKKVKKRTLFYDADKTAPEVGAMLEELSCEYPVCAGSGDVEVEYRFSPCDSGDRLRVKKCSGNKFEVEYSSVVMASRGTAMVMAGLECEESRPFESMGVMLDCSRNAVMKPERVKKLLRRLALSGYKLVMFYTEDTYLLPDEPYFGYMRGAYSLAELREMDDHAARLGMELVGCIQTLGHLEQIIKWSYYDKIRDTARVLRTDLPGTYELIGKMLDFWSSALRSRRIHLGMDETHDLGRGKYLDYNGYTPPFELFNRHLGKVNELCEARGLAPLIWSDMYFRMSNPEQEYYCQNDVPAEVSEKIPGNVQLVYWDYYHRDAAEYRRMIRSHRKMGFEPVMASGIWTWGRFFYDHEQTVETAAPCIEACVAENVKEFFFTMWGDDGALCDWDSIYAGLFHAADLTFGAADEKRTARVFAAVCRADYREVLEASRINLKMVGRDGEKRNVYPASLLWDDPLMGMTQRNCGAAVEDFEDRATGEFERIEEALRNAKGGNRGGDLERIGLLAGFLACKLRYRRDLVAAYRTSDRKKLRRLAGKRWKELLRRFDRLDRAMRDNYLLNSKAFGLEILELRNGGFRARLFECRERLREFLGGRIEAIDELECVLPEDAPPFNNHWLYGSGVATACRLIFP